MLANLSDMMISISEIKKQLSEVVNKAKTKIIVKNNVPLSVIMPYEEYERLINTSNDIQGQLKGIGQEIVVKDGVKVIVVVENKEEEIAIKTFKQMKTTGDYKLHYTSILSAPNYEETLTNEELMEYWDSDKK